MAEPQHSTAAAPEPQLEAPAVPAALEADTNVEAWDNDSSLGSETAESSTASINSSIAKYREENGRTYHAYKDGIYVMPNDEPENDRLDLQHHIFLLTFSDKLYTAPIPPTQTLHNILDVGTGTGIWSIDMADEHPESTIYGVDLSPIQPSFVPVNVRFEIDDLEQPWTFSVKFDFIYCRMMVASFANWPGFFSQCFEGLNEGGWLEVVDICLPIQADDDSLPEDSALRKWTKLLLEGTAAIGRHTDAPTRYKQQLQDAGFSNIEQTMYKWPQNRWPKDPKMKELGLWVEENLTRGVAALSFAVFTRVLGWSKEETELFLIDVRKDMKNPRMHSYWNIYVFTAQKPTLAST